MSKRCSSLNEVATKSPHFLFHSVSMNSSLHSSAHFFSLHPPLTISPFLAISLCLSSIALLFPLSVFLLSPPLHLPNQETSFSLSIFSSSFLSSWLQSPLPLHLHSLHLSLPSTLPLFPSLPLSLSLTLSPHSLSLSLPLSTYLQPVGVDSLQQEDHLSPLQVQLRLAVAAKVKHRLGHTRKHTHTHKGKPHTHTHIYKSVSGERKERGERRTHSTPREKRRWERTGKTSHTFFCWQRTTCEDVKVRETDGKRRQRLYFSQFDEVKARGQIRASVSRSVCVCGCVCFLRNRKWGDARDDESESIDPSCWEDGELTVKGVKPWDGFVFVWEWNREREGKWDGEKERDDRAASFQAFGAAADLSACLCAPNILAVCFV